MNLKIINIADAGIANKERVHIKVVLPDNIGRYAIFDTIQTEPGKVSSAVKNVYWFPDKEVRAGDDVILYSRTGTNSQITNENGTSTAFYYWGKNKTLWNSANDSVVLVKIESWDYKSVG